MTTIAMPSEWPLVLAGPMPRRVEPDAVSVFVVCKHARSVRLSIYDGTEPDPRRLIHEHDGRTLPLGRFLHAAMLTARPPTPLAPGRVYGYHLGFERAGRAAPGDDGPANADLAALGLLDRLSYEPGHLPSFVLPPERLDQVRVGHGSCRKPQGGRRDALATLDQILAESHADSFARPQQLFLTGDQIYADEVHPAVLALAGAVGRAALGWELAEALPGLDADDFRLAPTRRSGVVRRQAGYTGPTLHSHLISLAEFYGMYLLAWSDALWPRGGDGALTLPTLIEVLDHPRWQEAASRKALRQALVAILADQEEIQEFTRALPRVRRALANVASYMIFDDHDVTDDWNLHRQWREKVHRRPLGHRMVQNALAAYAVFQGWGNEPAQFEPDRPGGLLLAALQVWDGAADKIAAEIGARLGLPGPVLPDGSESIRWDYHLDTPCYQVIVLDTRTQRGYRPGGTGRAAPALLGASAVHRQLTRRFADRDREVPITLVVSAAPVFGHPFIEAWVQVKRIKAIEWFERGPAAVDREAWSLNRAAFEALLVTLADFDKVVILSGDVHYGFAGTVDYSDRRATRERRARFIQCTSSALKGEDMRTRLLGGVPTVVRVPTTLGSGIERVLERLTAPPPVTMLGWSADPRPGRWRRSGRRQRPDADPIVLPAPLKPARRLAAEPEWRYHVDFRADHGGDARAPGRSRAAHQRAQELRATHGWALMNCIVGRNNLGDIEFLPGIVRQSLWFDKTAIRSEREPERLPYTVYDLPLHEGPPSNPG